VTTMSQDLLAAFGAPEQSSKESTSTAGQPQSSSPFSFFDDVPSTSFAGPSAVDSANQLTSNKPAGDLNDEDDWGDFEGAESPAANQGSFLVQETESKVISPSRYQYSLDDLGGAAPKADITSTLDFDLVSLGGSSQTKPVQHQKSKPVANSNVLFDANEESTDEELDDFGDFEDFEEPAIQPVQQPVAAEVDLLGLDDDFQPAPPPPQLHSETTPMASVDRQFGASGPKPVSIEEKVEEAKEVERDESWDDFSPWQDNSAQEESNPGSNPTAAASAGLDMPDFGVPAGISDDVLPPTNIPPPALLLSLFPPIFGSMDDAFFKQTASQDAATRSAILSDSRAINSLKGYLALATVSGRIIAGRKSRWKRDTLLSQSMRIGPAGGRTSGMKVTSVDKAEAAKEDREVADVLKSWSQQIGRLKSVVADAKKTSSVDLGNIPELRDPIPVKSLKQSDGAVVSTRPCGLCGLKREERVAKVDFEVLDSFGEWWVQRPNMHRGQ
jgi:hypothetical protein